MRILSPRAYYNEIDPKAAATLRELIRRDVIAPGEVDERSIEDVCPSDLRGFQQCHFFAGIGIWSYALRRAGWSDWRPVWTGSCPCQPFSAAGKGSGFTDERHLWPAFHHLIAIERPPVIFGEQVASRDGLAWFDLVQSDLEGADYASGATDTCAAGYGAPHIRQRLYWVAHPVSVERGEVRVQRLREIQGAEGSRAATESTGGGRHLWVGDAQQSGLERHSRDGDDSHQPGRIPAHPTSGAGGVADANVSRQSGPGFLGRSGDPAAEANREVDRAFDAGWRGGMADTTGGRRGKECPHDGGFTSGDRTQGFPTGSVHGGGNLGRPGPTNGYWRDADWLFCRDGKWRAVESGTFPLANGAAPSLGRSDDSGPPRYVAGTGEARVQRLKGYGNGIVAQQAQAFIEAYLDTLPPVTYGF